MVGGRQHWTCLCWGLTCVDWRLKEWSYLLFKFTLDVEEEVWYQSGTVIWQN
jgi:hypothetical protein